MVDIVGTPVEKFIKEMTPEEIQDHIKISKECSFDDLASSKYKEFFDKKNSEKSRMLFSKGGKWQLVDIKNLDIEGIRLNISTEKSCGQKDFKTSSVFIKKDGKILHSLKEVRLIPMRRKVSIKSR